jgi:hypothetical protein
MIAAPVWIVSWIVVARQQDRRLRLTTWTAMFSEELVARRYASALPRTANGIKVTEYQNSAVPFKASNVLV